MSPRSREKIALVVFAALILLSMFGLSWYLFAGHSWNVAASNLDDTFGSMDGYTAIVYAGIQEPEAVSAADAEGYVSASDKVGTDVKATETIDDGNAGVKGTAGKNAADDRDGAASGIGSSAVSPDADSSPNVSSIEEATESKTATVAEVKAGYEEKGATVFSLDTADPSHYEEGTILKKGGHRFGVFSVASPISKHSIEKQAAYFSDYKVDFVVALTPDKSLLQGIEGVDIVVSTRDEELFVMGETINGTLYVDVPEIGTVGAILISPSNVVSAKVIEEV